KEDRAACYLIWNLSNLVNIAEKSLEEFPCRTIPPFTPWFPSGRCAMRSWSVFKQGSAFNKTIHPFSGHFQKVVERFRLHSLQRAKWIIAELNCVTSSLEDVWTVLTRTMRQSKLPTCNANIQRDLAQIWVFCDVLYSEYVGHFLKREFKLTGQISLSVHKQGAVFSM
uniref:Zgc:101664 n=1 Tax=Scleropages formosus TaxID=113540 RepID=A0A8C9SHJ1_SCLFO